MQKPFQTCMWKYIESSRSLIFLIWIVSKNINIKSWNQIILVEMNLEKKREKHYWCRILGFEDAQMIRELWDFLILFEIE